MPSTQGRAGSAGAATSRAVPPMLFSEIFSSVSFFKFDIIGVDDPCMRVRRHDLLPYRFGSPADEEEAPRYPVYDLPERVGALDAACDRVALDQPLDRHPRIAPAKCLHRVNNDRPGRGLPDDGCVPEFCPQFYDGRRRGLGRRFDPLEFNAEIADALGICRPESLQLRDAEIQHHVRRGSLACLCPVDFDIGHQRGLVRLQPTALALLRAEPCGLQPQ